MEAKNYFCCLIVISVWTNPIVKCFNVIPVLIDVKNESKEIFSIEKEFTNYCDVNFSRPRVSKCCDLEFGYSSDNKSCVKTIHEFLPDFEDCDNHSEKAKKIPLKKRYEYYIDPCREESFLLEPEKYPEDRYAVYSNGILLLQNVSYELDGYCLETVDGVLKAFFCFESGQVKYSATFIFTFYASGLLISVPVLIITAMLYLCIDELRDLKGKSLACHCLCLAFAYLFLAIVQLATDFLSDEACEALGFLIQYFFVSAFMWLNVLCYDMWNCIKNDMKCQPGKIDLKSQKLVFILYCLYGFYGSACLSIVSLIMNYISEIPETYVKPKFGFRSCWFHWRVAALSYFYGPLAVILSFNLMFFALSALKIYKAKKREAKLLTERECNNEMRIKIRIFRIYLNILKECFFLFILMGLNFTAEVLSWASATFDFFWAIIDIFNLFQGITIFIIFVLRPVTVRNIIQHKIRLFLCKIIKCNRNYTENHEHWVPIHWHADVSSNSGNRESELVSTK